MTLSRFALGFGLATITAVAAFATPVLARTVNDETPVISSGTNGVAMIFARRGADDPAGDDRGGGRKGGKGRGGHDDGINHTFNNTDVEMFMARRGADDPTGDDRGGERKGGKGGKGRGGNDDGPNHT